MPVKIVNDMKFSTRNISPLGVAIGMSFAIIGAALLKSGAQSIIYGVGFRGKVTVYK